MFVFQVFEQPYMARQLNQINFAINNLASGEVKRVLIVQGQTKENADIIVSKVKARALELQGLIKKGISEGAEPPELQEKIISFNSLLREYDLSSRVFGNSSSSSSTTQSKTDSDMGFFTSSDGSGSSYTAYTSMLDHVRDKKELPQELLDKNDPKAQELAFSLILDAIQTGRKEEAAFLIGQYLNFLGSMATQNPSAFEEINSFLNANPDAKIMALSASLDSEAFVSFLKLIKEGFSKQCEAEYQSKKEFYDGIPEFNTKDGLGRGEVIAVNAFLSMIWESSKKNGIDFGDRIKEATDEYMQETRGNYNPFSVVWSTLKYAGSMYVAAGEQFATMFGLKSTYDYFKGKDDLSKSSDNPLADIYNVSLSGNTAKMDWAMNILFFAVPELKGVATGVKTAFTGFASRFGTEAAMKTFQNLTEGYIAKGFTRELAMQEAAKFMQSNLGAVSSSYFEMGGNLNRIGKHFAFDDGNFILAGKNRLLQYGVTDVMSNAGIKAHFCLPPTVRGNYQFIEGLYLDLMNLWKESGGKFGFKYMDGMSGSQMGKDFTIYFSDIETYQNYAAKIKSLIDQRLAPYGGYGKASFEEFAGNSSSKVNMSNEISYSGTNGYFRFAVRTFNDESVFIRPQYVQSLVQSEAYTNDFINDMVQSGFLKPISDKYGTVVLYEIDGNAARNLTTTQRNVFMNRVAGESQLFTYDKVNEGFSIVR